MQNRREFLTSALATGASFAATRLFGQESEKPELGINDRLRKISASLQCSAELGDIKEHFVDSPTAALVQWRWVHFTRRILDRHLPTLEKANDEIYSSMQTVHAVEGTGLDALMLEGLVEDRWKTQIEEYREIHRYLIQRQFTTVIPFGIGQDIAPTEETVDRELNVAENLQRPVHQVVYPNGRPRTVKASPLGRLGAGYMMHTQKGVALLPAEDPFIDAKAEWAEGWGTQEEFDRWVMTERDKHFVKLVQDSKRQITHLLVGANHDLTNDTPKDMSHMVITVKSVMEAEKAGEFK